LIENAQPDARDDIYSLACVAYEMLQGRHPFNKMQADVARDNKLKPAPIKGLPKQQWKMLQQGLAFNREDRPASVEIFLAGLCRQQPRARWPKVVIAIFVIGVLASGALYFYPTTQSPPPPQASTAVVSNSTPATPVQLTDEQQQTISHLLEAADIHFAVHRITEPEGSNAFAAYQHVLEIDPNNAQAKAGLQKIADYYENLAQQSLQKGDVKNAQSMIKIGLKVLPADAGLLALQQQTLHKSPTQAVVTWLKDVWKKISQ
jgi:serine/threonine protein kinase